MLNLLALRAAMGNEACPGIPGSVFYLKRSYTNKNGVMNETDCGDDWRNGGAARHCVATGAAANADSRNTPGNV
ncbi:hypothetical protein MPUCK001_37560 [Citrobacter koseri]|nr:hypothetical protein MPUCK001_37560 [Citrobacter koseri]